MLLYTVYIPSHCQSPGRNCTALLCALTQGDYDEEADVWAVGVILYILLCGRPPFEHALDDEVFRMIVDNGKPDFSYHVWDNITEPAKVGVA